MNLKILDDIVRVDDKECFLMTRDMTRKEALFVGGSGGAAVAGAVKWAKQRKGPLKILVFLCDGGQKYVSKIFNDDWMRENGFLDEEPGLGTVADILHMRGKRKIVTTTSSAKVKDVIATLKQLGISQLPVVDKKKLRGVVGEVDLLRHLVGGRGTPSSPIADLVESDYATVTPDTKLELLQGVLADARAAIVMERDDVVGIVTKIDLIEYLAKKNTEAADTKPRVAKKKPKKNGARERRV
jgi:cystathionine beta-synthase